MMIVAARMAQRADHLRDASHTGDVVPLVPTSKSPMRRLMESSRFLRLSQLFRAKPREAHIDEIGTRYASDAGFEMFTTTTIIIIGLMLLLGPMWWLQEVANDVKRLGIITGFVSLFTLLLTLSTISRPFEVLAATAA